MSSAESADHGELRRRKKRGPVELVSKSTVTKLSDNVLKSKDDSERKENIKQTAAGTEEKKEKDAYSPEFWYELKYTVVRCVLMIVIFFVLNYYFNTYVLDPMFHRGSYYQKLQKQRRINEIRSRVCPQGAIDCNVDLSNLEKLNL